MMHSDPQQEETSLDHVLKYTGVFGGVQGLNILMGIIRNKLTSRLIGAAGIGVMGFYVSVGEFINSCANMGIPVSTVQHLSELFETGDAGRICNFIRVVRTWCLWAAVLSLVLCCVAAALYERRLVLLAPMVASMLLTGGELSVLKGLRRLKRVAAISALSAVATLLLTVPFLWAFGLGGIILSLDCTAVAVLAIHLTFTVPLYPWRVAPFSRQVLLRGLPLLRIGLPLVLSGIAGTGMFVVLQGFLKDHGSETLLGFYRVGYTIMVTYAGIAFTALESDYFPRLSSVNHDAVRRNATINQQVRACLLLLPPMLIVLIAGMPVILQLLYTEEFLPVVEMTVCAVFYMFFRCLSVPIAYTALARGDSHTYLLMELIYDVVSLGIVISCFLAWGLAGIGIGLSLSGCFDLLLVGLTYGRRYQVRLEGTTARLALVQGVLLSGAVAVCLLLPGAWKYGGAAMLFLLAAGRSYQVLRRESDFVQRLRNKLRP